MITSFNEIFFVFLYHKNKVKQWVKQIAFSEGKRTGDINYMFCDGVCSREISVQHLQHDTLADIITFDYTEGTTLNSDIYISIGRVREDADIFGVTFGQELLQVLAHGILHLRGYRDRIPTDSKLMHTKEDEKTKLFGL